MNAKYLSYEQDVAFKTGDIFVLEGRAVLAYSVKRPEKTVAPPGTWGIIVFGSEGPCAFLADTSYYLFHQAQQLAVAGKSSGIPPTRLRIGKEGTEIMDREDEWTLAYGDRKNILQEGPAFQFVPYDAAGGC